MFSKINVFHKMYNYGNDTENLFKLINKWVHNKCFNLFFTNKTTFHIKIPFY